MSELRPYQSAAVEAVADAFKAGSRSTLVVMGTGLGKTHVFSEVCHRVASRGRRVLVVAHQTELLNQAARRLAARGVDCAIEQADRRAGDASVVVASMQTLRGARLESWPSDAFAMVIIDEAHHATSDGYGAILSRFPRARVLGVTATPDRLDGTPLGDVFESVAYRYDMREGIRDGWLVPLRAKRVLIQSVDLDDVKMIGGDFAPESLAQAMGDEAALHGVAVPFLELSAGRKSIMFAANVAHATNLADVLNRYSPGNARSISGMMSTAERDAIIGGFRAGKFPTIVNCALLTEGFDEPGVSCIAAARPTRSRALYAQIVGRGTRIAPGKRDLLILDFAGNTSSHRLAGPADVLAGKEVSDDLRKAIEDELSDGERDLSEAIEAAEAKCAAKSATVVHDVEDIDPWAPHDPAPTPAPTIWIKRWHDEIAAEPDAPGVWRRKAGGFHVRARVKDARTGQLREVNCIYADVRSVREAASRLAKSLAKKAGHGTSGPIGAPRLLPNGRFRIQWMDGSGNRQSATYGDYDLAKRELEHHRGAVLREQAAAYIAAKRST